jgi:hypothetical protein
MFSTGITETPNCSDCIDDLEHCHDVSLEHADGTTECLADGCAVRHELHDWQVSCAALDPPCPCAAEEAPAPIVIDLAA